MKKILIGLVVILSLMVGLIRIGIGNWAFFSDIEVSSKNIFQADLWRNNPRLCFHPAESEVEIGTSPVNYFIRLANSSQEPKDLAKNVELEVSIVKGQEYISQILCDPVIGDIEPGRIREFPLTINLTGWKGSPQGEKVKLRIEVSREDNWPEHNIGKQTYLTIIKN